ncbi:retinal dehydrogenase 1 [Cephus cinctus]|uniref:Retinal dehydrogenase 1 n=1 Tax=Cephus cinctus TaxID=211228 RepID=A0AAJ7C2U6_CEPCN|nr:retinal dehydrogenase 1 [Cephus cinctus]
MLEAKPDPNPTIKYTKLFINNEWVDAVSGRKLPTINPATEKVIVEVAEGDKADIDKAVAAAKAAFARGSEWRRLTASARGELLIRLADLIGRDINQIASLESIDNGKPFSNSFQEVYGSIKIFKYYAGLADKVGGQTMPTDENELGFTRKEPLGIVGAIIPWNYPFILLAMKLAPALAAGCTLVLKPAELTPLSALYIGTLIQEAGFPKGVVNIVPGYGATAGNALAEHSDVRKLAFTGSTVVGHKILEAAGRTTLKRVTLELGGKSPLVVFDDADLDKAVGYTCHGVFLNAGQTCIAPTRIFVQSSVHDKFIEKAVAFAKTVKIGGAFEPDVFQGPQISELQFKKVLAYIESGIKEGAKLECGGSRHGTDGYFIQPTIFSNVTDDMKIAKEEIFGPVTCILKFETFEEVVQRANNTKYGLASGVFTNDITKALEFAKAIEAGSVGINQWVLPAPHLPFGGYKQSGFGRELGTNSLDEFLEIKTISISLPTNN